MDFERRNFCFESGDGSYVKLLKGYLDLEACQRLFDEISTYDVRQSDLKIYGKMQKTPRKQAWMADKGVKADVYAQTPALEWTKLMKKLKKRMEKIIRVEYVPGYEHFHFNYALFNVYEDGSHYIGYHSDKEVVKGKEIIVSVSLGAARRFVMKHKQSPLLIDITLEKGDILIMAGKTQTYWEHSVPKTVKVKEPRINITFRYAE